MARMQWTNPLKEAQLIEAAKNNTSVAGMCRELGLVDRGGNINTLQKHIVRLGIDTSHHTGQVWNKEKYAEPSEGQHKTTIRRRLLRERGLVCECCDLSEWMGKPIPLEIDHIDGNNLNNEESNLQVLCSNCHAQTPTFRNKKRL